MAKIISLYEEAKDLEGLGFALSPWSIEYGVKKPTKGAEQWVNDHKSVDGWRTQFESCDCIAIICGKRSGGVCLIDIDQKNDPTGSINNGFTQHLKSLYPEIYDKLYIESTMSNGLHFVFKLENVGRKLIPAKGADGRALIEVLGEGQLFICAPSKGYTVKQGSLEELETLSETEYRDLLEVCRSFNQMPDDEAIEEVRSDVALDTSLPGDDWGSRINFPEYLQSYGWTICGEKDGTVYLRRPGKDVGISATFNHGGYGRLWIFSSSTELMDGKMLKPFHVYAHYEFDGDYKKASGELRKQGFGDGVDKFKKLFDGCREASEVKNIIKDNPGIAKMTGLDWEEIKMHIEAMDIKKISNRELDRYKKIIIEDRKENEDWQSELEKNDNDEIKPKLGNLHIIFKNDERLSEMFKFNEFDQKIYINAGYLEGYENFRVLTDRDLSELRVWLSTQYQDFKKADIEDVMETRSGWITFHPLKEKLEELQWDGVKRIDNWLVTVMGAKDTKYVREVGRYWLIAAIARIYSPGCQVDNMLVIEGAQGKRKSSFFRKLAMGFFTDQIADISTKDAAIDLFGKWIIEIAELDALKGKSAEKTKAFISRREDHIRLPHDKCSGDHPRQCLFVGTTNQDAYLVDVSGNRRYWPVRVHRIDMSIDVSQLWAEALQEYKNGAQWWPDDVSEFESEQDARMVDNDVAPLIQEYMARMSLDYITTKQVHVDILAGKLIDLHKKRNEHAEACKRAGLIRKRIKGVWCFCVPPAPLENEGDR